MKSSGRIRRMRRIVGRGITGLAALCVCLILAVQSDFIRIRRLYRTDGAFREPVALRKFPYPFRAALSIASDIDNTETPEEFISIQEFLNTDHPSPYGKGVDLEIGNSFYLYDRPGRNEFSYFSDRAEDREIIRRYAHSGLLESIHSYGEGCTTRVQAVSAIRSLERDGCRVPLWINHSNARSNMATWFSTNRGDCVFDAAYHADVTVPYGIRYVNLGSSTSIVGQDAAVSWRTYCCIHDRGRSLKSMRNSAKSFFKRALSQFGILRAKYFLHRDNALIGIRKLQDGRRVYEFMRYEVDPDGIGYGATARGLAANISENVIQRLLEVEGAGIVYTHLGKNGVDSIWVSPFTANALRNLSRHSRAGHILVTTTYKLLNYCTVRRALRWTFDADSTETVIRIHGIRDPLLGEIAVDGENMQGITFFVPEGKPVRIFVGKSEWRNWTLNPPDESGRPSVSFPWVRLKPPECHATRR
jgi:hypothetical protein